MGPGIMGSVIMGSGIMAACEPAPICAIIDRHAAEWLRRPFQIGVDDCAFALRALLEEAGACSVFANRIGEARTEAAIEQMLADETGGFGLARLIDRIASVHGWKRVDPLDAVDGDLGLTREKRGAPAFLGIARGPVFLTRTREGFAGLPKRVFKVAYRVRYGA